METSDEKHSINDGTSLGLNTLSSTLQTGWCQRDRGTDRADRDSQFTAGCSGILWSSFLLLSKTTSHLLPEQQAPCCDHPTYSTGHIAVPMPSRTLTPNSRGHFEEGSCCCSGIPSHCCEQVQAAG